MIPHRGPVRVGALLLAVFLAAVSWQACGGGGGGGTGGGSAGTPRPPVTEPGQRFTQTPNPSEIPTPGPDIVVVLSGEDIAEAARNAFDGAVIVVAPGTYGSVVLNPDDLPASLTFLADVTGEMTDSPAAPVTIVASSSDEAAFEGFSQSDLIIDGFTVRGGTDAGFLFGDSANITIRNCTVTAGAGDAVRFERSDDSLIFNNLLYGNKGGGVTAFGTQNLQIINNTIYNNTLDGIFLSFDENDRPSTNAMVVNNILDKNTPTGLVVDVGPPSSLAGFDGDFNLNRNGYEGAEAGANDITADPLFIFPSGGDLHLASASRAIDHGTDGFDSDLVSVLQQRSTQSDGSPDALPPDIGYHYRAPIPTPTKVPKPTRTSTGVATATRTGGVPGATATPTRSAAPTATTTPAGRPTRTLKPTRTPKS